MYRYDQTPHALTQYFFVHIKHLHSFVTKRKTHNLVPTTSSNSTPNFFTIFEPRKLPALAGGSWPRRNKPIHTLNTYGLIIKSIYQIFLDIKSYASTTVSWLLHSQITFNYSKLIFNSLKLHLSFFYNFVMLRMCYVLLH